PVLLKNMRRLGIGEPKWLQPTRVNAVQVQLLPDALDSSFVYRLEDTSLSRWRDGFDSHTSYYNWPSGGTGRHATLRTSCLRAWEFDSPLGHCGVDWSWFPAWS